MCHSSRRVFKEYLCNLSAVVPYIVKGISRQVSFIYNPEAKRRSHLLSSYFIY